MPKLTSGCEIALGKWLQEEWLDEYMEADGLTADGRRLLDSFRAGYGAALKYLHGYITHLEEQVKQAETEGDEVRWRALHLGLSNARNCLLWIDQGVTCGVPEHSHCQAHNQATFTTKPANPTNPTT